jgi:diaminohydroxyphosphoribosylaminopyrimidine deaminase/5-amino-6-(5-phosphoribosylamino)uracil reductase
LDSRLRLPLSSKIFQQPDSEKTIVAASITASSKKARAIEARGAQVWRLPLRAGRIAWRPLLRRMARAGIVSVMIEGGAAVAASALADKVVDKVLFFYAPKILGGDARVMIDGLNLRHVSQAIALRNIDVRRSGGDLLVIGYL